MTARARYAPLLLGVILAAGACAPSTLGTTSERTPAPAAPKAVASAAVPPEKPFIPVGTFTAAPRTAPAGARVTAAAAGLTPGASYDLVWAAYTGSWTLTEDKAQYKGRTFVERRAKLTTVTADAAGAFGVEFTVPSGFGFMHDLMVIRGNEVLNKLGFEVEMRVSISPTSGPVGTPITIEAEGIGFRDMENSWLVSYDNTFTGWLSAVTTEGHAKAVIPAAGTVGAHTINVLHGHMSWPYLNMQQSPRPDRPQFHLPFTVTDGPPVLPAPARTQTVTDVVTVPDGTNARVEPPSGIVGSAGTLRASGLAANADVEVGWVNVAGRDWVAGSRPDRVETLGTARTDGSGALVFAFSIPDQQGGLHPLELRSGGRIVGKAFFLVAPSIEPLAVDRGPAGTEFVVQLHGMYATDTGKIVNLTYDNAAEGYACSFNSGGNIKITLRASGGPGWHFIDLYPGILTGEEITPMNYRVPQLTGAVDHPGERMPIFRAAFLVTAP